MSNQTIEDEARLRALWKDEEAQPFIGFDFAYLHGRMLDEAPPWSYTDVVQEAMGGVRALLDLGTGGGEKLAQHSHFFPPTVVATEGYPPNLALARARLEPFGVQVVEARDALDQILPFEPETFDLVINRHTACNVTEVARVLQPGGVFITQQVDGSNLDDLAAAFDSTNPWPDYSLAFMLERVAETGLVVEHAQAWDGYTRFSDVGAIVYYLKAIPWIVQDFSVDKHFRQLKKLHHQLAEHGELTFTRRLFWMQARKRQS